MPDQRTQFDYLLNAFEQASQSDEPAANGYAEKRRALFAYVRGLEAPPAAPALDTDRLRAFVYAHTADNQRRTLLLGDLDALAAASRRAEEAERAIRAASERLADGRQPLVVREQAARGILGAALDLMPADSDLCSEDCEVDEETGECRHAGPVAARPPAPPSEDAR